jgi:flagellar biosynthesis anti-sigma factor FlgM
LVKICDRRKEGQKIQYIQGMKPARFKKNPMAVNDGRTTPISDRLEISPRSPDMKRIHQILAPAPEIRMEKVVELKKTIVGGTYEVRAEDIADRMIREVILELNR